MKSQDTKLLFARLASNCVMALVALIAWIAIQPFRFGPFSNWYVLLVYVFACVCLLEIRLGRFAHLVLAKARRNHG